MAKQTGDRRGNDQQKVSSVAFVTGFLMIFVSTIWVTTVGLGDPLQSLSKFSENIYILQIVALLFTLGWWAVLVGTVGVFQSISSRGAVWARLGLVFMIMGSTLWTLGMALDISYSNLIANWLAAGEADKAFARDLVTIYSPTVGIGRGLFPMNVMSNWIAFGFLSLGMLRTPSYPRWIGWAGLAVGTIGFVTGMVMVFTGREAIWTFFTIISFLSLLWLLALGIWMAREAWSGPAGPD